MALSLKKQNKHETTPKTTTMKHPLQITGRLTVNLCDSNCQAATRE